MIYCRKASIYILHMHEFKSPYTYTYSFIFIFIRTFYKNKSTSLSQTLINNRLTLVYIYSQVILLYYRTSSLRRLMFKSSKVWLPGRVMLH